jgi:outer membrane protein assembly factor BamE (lipoprotein component of BamABCDE complex)
MKTRLSIVATCLLCLALVACGPRVSQENYEKIRNDMSTEEVNKVLGKPTQVSSFGIGGLSATTAKWVGQTHTITVTFANEKVKMKSYAENESASKQ